MDKPTSIEDIKLNYFLFTGKNCPACEVMKKTVGSMNLGHFEFDINSKEGAKMASDFLVRGIPTFIGSLNLFPNGEIVRIKGSVNNKEQLKKMIDDKIKENFS